MNVTAAIWLVGLSNLSDSRRQDAVTAINAVLTKREEYDYALQRVDELIAPDPDHPIHAVLGSPEGDFERLISSIYSGDDRFDSLAEIIEALAGVLNEESS